MAGINRLVNASAYFDNDERILMEYRKKFEIKRPMQVKGWFGGEEASYHCYLNAIDQQYGLLIVLTVALGYISIINAAGEAVFSFFARPELNRMAVMVSVHPGFGVRLRGQVRVKIVASADDGARLLAFGLSNEMVPLVEVLECDTAPDLSQSRSATKSGDTTKK